MNIPLRPRIPRKKIFKDFLLFRDILLFEQVIYVSIAEILF